MKVNGAKIKKKKKKWWNDYGYKVLSTFNYFIKSKKPVSDFSKHFLLPLFCGKKNSIFRAYFSHFLRAVSSPETLFEKLRF